MASGKLVQIIALVEEYIQERCEAEEWIPGQDWVKYAGPYFDSQEYVNAVVSLLGGWLGLDKDSIKFERGFPKMVGKKYGVLTNSGSSANLLMMSAMTSKRLYNFPKGTQVITPIAGFPTTINPIFQVGFEPIFVDICLENLNLDLDQVEEAAKKGAKIITFAHALGNPPNMDRLTEIISRYNLVFLEDCCDALGSTYAEKLLGEFGEMASVSFYPAHHMTLGEGGFVATKTFDQEKIVRSFRDWGRGCFCVGKEANLLQDGTCKKRFSNWLPTLPDNIFDHKYVYEEIGYNLKPIELQASIGLAQLEKLDEIHVKRRQNYRHLFDIFSEYEEFFHLPRRTEKSEPSWFAFPLTIRDSSSHFNRSDITTFLERYKIQTRTFFAGNIMLQPAYDHLIDTNLTKGCPVARKVTTDTFFLGCSPVITKQQLEYIEEIMALFFRQYF